jgi:uncharacterized membrane protein (UPF0127 family)
MIGRKFANSKFDAMVFNRCNCIHTLFMATRIDVLFVDIEGKVCGMRQALPPWLPYIKCRRAFTTIELPTGTIEDTGTEAGDIINLSSEVVPELEEQLDEKKMIRSVESVISFKESKK